jgi:hypothetical protein
MPTVGHCYPDTSSTKHTIHIPQAPELPLPVLEVVPLQRSSKYVAVKG